MTKVLFRAYEGGEVVALFPCESGDPCGNASVAYAGAGGFYSADADKVLELTRTAEKREYARLQKELTDEPNSLELELLEEVPADAKAQRMADPDKFKQYGRVARLHAHR